MTLQLTGTNHQGSTLLALAGGTATAINYSPSGATRARSGSLSSLPGFNGERADPLSAVTHLGNGYRAYSPALQRFTCPDSESPFGVGGINPYAYCEGDPVNLSDPSGHGPVTWLIRKAVTIGIRLGLRSAAAESMSASLAALSGVETGLEVAATAATGIASKATEKTNPQASQRLKWASVGLGAVMGVYGAGKAGARISKSMKRRSYSRLQRKGKHRLAIQVLAYDVSPEGKDFLEEGFISHFSLTGEPALVFHGTQDGEFIIRGSVRESFTPEGRRIFEPFDEENKRWVNAEGLVEHLTENGIDFNADEYRDKRIHLLSCYGKLNAQALANATGKTIVAYSKNRVWVESRLAAMDGIFYKVNVEYSMLHPLQCFGAIHPAKPREFYPQIFR